MKRHFKPSGFRLSRLGKAEIAFLLIGLCLLTAWSLTGTRIISTLNPTLRRELSLALHPALDVWITPPEFAGSQPIIISTPAGIMFEHDTIMVPQGSIVSAHLAEQGGDAPELAVDGDRLAFTTDPHGDFAATEKLTGGSMLSIRRGPMTLATWKINVIADAPPKITMTEPLSITASKALRVAYSASDDFGVATVALRVTARDPLPGANNKPVDIDLPVAEAKHMTRVDFADMIGHPWAGQQVSIQLVATNAAGKSSVSAPVDFTLPERAFFHPVARVLIEERRKLLMHPDDEALREEAADIMAGIAHETANYHGDPVILMSLRAGAVRLILDRGHDSALSVNDLLWQAATRIEDGNGGQAEQMLHDARQDLADAVRHNAGQGEIETLTARMKMAMQDYLAQLAQRPAAHADNRAQTHLVKSP